MNHPVHHQFAVAVTAFPGSARADVRLVGDIGTEAVPLLADAVHRLAEGAPRSVFIDLGGVTAAGPELVDFLVQAHDRLPRSSTLVLCRPAPATAPVLAASPALTVMTVCAGMLG